MKRLLHPNQGALLWRYHFACAERVTRSDCNNPGCGPGKQLVRPSKMATSEEITFVLLLLNFMKEFESMKLTKKGKGFQKKNSDNCQTDNMRNERCWFLCAWKLCESLLNKCNRLRWQTSGAHYQGPLLLVLLWKAILSYTFWFVILRSNCCTPAENQLLVLRLWVQIWRGWRPTGRMFLQQTWDDTFII